LWVVISTTSARVHATTTSVFVLPSHLSIGNQQFDASLTGFREYLDRTKVSDPRLYTQLAPDLDRLESRAQTARLILVAGLVGGVVSGIYAIGGRKDCPGPIVTDPAFAAKTAAWGTCNDNNMRMTATFTLVGMGSIMAGAVGYWAIGPKRRDILELVNKHNRLSQEPLHIELGFNPTRGFAYGGATIAF
jgi:hypothetical protein